MRPPGYISPREVARQWRKRRYDRTQPPHLKGCDNDDLVCDEACPLKPDNQGDGPGVVERMLWCGPRRPEEAYIEMQKSPSGYRRGELASVAIIDNGCTSNVCSHDWLEGFKKISGLWFRQVKIVGPRKTFIFGSGEGKLEQYRVNLDLNLFGQKVSIITSVVEGDPTPFLLSREQLAEWDAVIGVRDSSLTMNIGGQLIKYTCPCSRSKLMLLDLLNHKELNVA